MLIIFPNFLKLDAEKQKRIINAAMKEFAQNGFKNASTDAIVKEAAISKGALFHYFNNKKDLFLFLYDFALDMVKEEILGKLNYEEKDIFARRMEGLILKTEVLKRHPEMYVFLGAAYLEGAVEVKSELDRRAKQLIEVGQAKLYSGIDTSKFREEIDLAKAIEIINWTMEGITNKQMQIIKKMPMEDVNFYELLQEVDGYMEMLKVSFYKKGGE